MATIIHNCTVFSNTGVNELLTNHAICMQGSRIIEIDDEAAMLTRYPQADRLDGGGKLLMPGLINVHMHFYSTFARGLQLKKPAKDFPELLARLWWKLDSSLDAEAVYYSALIPAITAVKSGVTAVVDHHASPQVVDGSLDQIESALAKVGLRGALCYEISDRYGPDITNLSLAENERYIKKCRQALTVNPDHLFNAMVGLHASFTVENPTLERAVNLAESGVCGCHVHVLEDPVDEKETRRKYGVGVIERLTSMNVLGDRTLAAHCIHLEETEKDLLARKQVMVAHNPRSNMNNAVGRTDLKGLLDRNVVTGLGTDGMSADIRRDLHAAFLLHKHDLHDINFGWQQSHNLLCRNNPEIYRRISGQTVGRIAAGALADLILVEYEPCSPMTADNFWGHFLFGISDAAVDTTIINGRIVMQNKQIPDIDESEIAYNAAQAAQRVWKKFHDA